MALLTVVCIQNAISRYEGHDAAYHSEGFIEQYQLIQAVIKTLLVSLTTVWRVQHCRMQVCQVGRC